MVARRSPPEIFAGRYELQNEVGTGNQGVVHRALDRETGETVALKRWRGEATPSARAAFEVGTRTIARLAGPGIVAYRSMGAVSGGLFLAMEWVPGGTLAERLARTRLSSREALDLTKRIACGLARIHRAGLAHGAVKPANVLLPEGALWCAKLSDVWVDTGAARRSEFDPALVGYLSPQVLRSGQAAAGPREDVYSLGAILFRCLAGCLPFPEHDRPDPAKIVPVPGNRRDLARLAPALPEELYDLVDRMLSDDPDRRPASAVEPCLVLHDVARMLGSYDKITEAELAPGAADLPPRFEAREGSPAAVAPAVEPEIEVDPAALRGPFVILDPPLDGGPVPAPPGEIRLHVGDLFAGRFKIEQIAGAGSTGVVYKAKDRETRDTVALRIIDGAASRREIKQLLADCAKHAQRYHPRIVRVLHRGAVAGRMFVVMDWVGGETLAARLAREPLTMREAVTVIRGLVEALELVHTMGLVQGNLCPHNVFLRNRNVEWAKLSDIAVRRPSSPGAPGRDPVYAAPEEVRTGETSQRADLYSLGVIAYQLVAGVLPFEARDAVELAALRWAPAQPLVEVRRDANPALCQLIDELLRRDPSRRPQSAVAAAGWLESKADLGWGIDLPPFPMTRSEDGNLAPVLPDRGPFDPQSDVRFQDLLASELIRRSDDPAAHARLSDVAHARAGAAQGTPPCALCGRGPAVDRRLIEVWGGGYFRRLVDARGSEYSPLEYKESLRARQPAICSGCLTDPHEPAGAAVKRALESYRGDDLRRIAVLGPRRREIREAIEALYARAVPRMGEGKCLVCRAAREVIVGRDIAMCTACLSAARRAYDAWVAEAPARNAARLQRTLDEIYLAAVVQVRGRAPRKAEEGAYPAPEGRGAYNFYRAMIDLRAEKQPAQRQIDAVADGFAVTLLRDVAEAMRQIPEVGAAPASTGAWDFLHLLDELRSRFRPGPASDEQIRIALAVMHEAQRRGARLYEREEGIETIGG